MFLKEGKCLVSQKYQPYDFNSYVVSEEGKC